MSNLKAPLLFYHKEIPETKSYSILQILHQNNHLLQMYQHIPSLSKLQEFNGNC